MADQVKFTQQLRGKKVLIIGGSAGIGYAVAEGVLENGGTAAISSSNPSRIKDAISKLQKAYPSASDRVSGYPCDLSNEDTLEENVKNLLEKVGKCDHIIFTAGDSIAATALSTIDMAKVKKAGMVRFFAPLMVGKYAPQYLGQGPESSIILTSGAVSEKPMQDWSAVGGYATGLHGMTRQLALDLKPIRVNLVSPGPVDTDLWAGMQPEAKQAMFESISARLPTGRVASPEDVAEAYFYLMKDRNITGSIISTNGGSLIAGGLI